MSSIKSKLDVERRFSVGQVAQIVGVKEHTIRFWTQKFGHIRIERGVGDRRYYTQKGVDDLKQLKYLMKECGMKIEEIQILIKDKKGSLIKKYGTRIQDLILHNNPKKVRSSILNGEHKVSRLHSNNSDSDVISIHDMQDSLFDMSDYIVDKSALGRGFEDESNSDVECVRIDKNIAAILKQIISGNVLLVKSATMHSVIDDIRNAQNAISEYSKIIDKAI